MREGIPKSEMHASRRAQANLLTNPSEWIISIRSFFAPLILATKRSFKREEMGTTNATATLAFAAELASLFELRLWANACDGCAIVFRDRHSPYSFQF